MIREKGRDMGKSKVTIKEIADMAGVSIATVSHVINRTRYVRPELVDKIEKIIVETGYQNKIADKERKLLVGRESTIVAVIPNIESTIYRDMVAYVKQLVSVQGYQFLVAITDNDLKEETQVLAGLLVNKKVAGIIHAPVSDVAANYTKLIQSGVPFVCVERNILGSGIDSGRLYLRAQIICSRVDTRMFCFSERVRTVPPGMREQKVS